MPPKSKERKKWNEKRKEMKKNPTRAKSAMDLMRARNDLIYAESGMKKQKKGK